MPKLYPALYISITKRLYRELGTENVLVVSSESVGKGVNQSGYIQKKWMNQNQEANMFVDKAYTTSIFEKRVYMLLSPCLTCFPKTCIVHFGRHVYTRVVKNEYIILFAGNIL